MIVVIGPSKMMSAPCKSRLIKPPALSSTAIWFTQEEGSYILEGESGQSPAQSEPILGAGIPLRDSPTPICRNRSSSSSPARESIHVEEAKRKDSTRERNSLGTQRKATRQRTVFDIVNLQLVTSNTLIHSHDIQLCTELSLKFPVHMPVGLRMLIPWQNFSRVSKRALSLTGCQR